jgi:hypothetical protein
MGDKRSDELKARLAGMMSGAGEQASVRYDGPRRVTVQTGGFGWGIWLMRGAALLFAGVFTLLAPVVTVDCATTAPGTAECTIATSTAGVRPLASEHYAGIAHAETTPDRSGIRLLDRREQVLYERTDSALVGLTMPALAERVQELVEGRSQAPVHGWQWPLPIAVLCTVALLFAASGLIPLFRVAWRAVFGQPSAEAAARADSNMTSWAFGLVATALGAGVLYVAPVVDYQCQSADGGARCTVARRYAGLFVLERTEVAGIARADASAYVKVERERNTLSNERRRTTESISALSFQDKDSRLLFEDEQSGAIGTSARDIADAVNEIADGTASAPIRRWQLPWVPALLASLGLLLGPPTLVVLLLGPMLPLRGRALLGGVAFVGMLLALAGGWALALLGHPPG